MKPSAFSLVLLAMLAGSCLKDGVLPPRVPPETEGTVVLRIDAFNGVRPWSAGMVLRDVHGRSVRLDHFSCVLHGFTLTDDDGTQVADFSERQAAILLGAANRFVLGTMAPAHIHALQFAIGPKPYPADGEPAMRIRGYVDLNEDGTFDDGFDLPFDLAVPLPGIAPLKHLHFHADVEAGAEVELVMRMDLNMLLLGIDAAALHHEAASHEQALLTNLSVCFMGE
jgi:hypothetical protein